MPSHCRSKLSATLFKSSMPKPREGLVKIYAVDVSRLGLLEAGGTARSALGSGARSGPGR